MAKKKGKRVSRKDTYFHNPVDALVLVKPAPPEQPPPTPAEAKKDKFDEMEREGL